MNEFLFEAQPLSTLRARGARPRDARRSTTAAASPPSSCRSASSPRAARRTRTPRGSSTGPAASTASAPPRSCARARTARSAARSARRGRWTSAPSPPRTAGGGHRNAAGCRVAGHARVRRRPLLARELAAAVGRGRRRLAMSGSAPGRPVAAPPRRQAGKAHVSRRRRRRAAPPRARGASATPGTLDPAATGLLVLCVGRAGRLQSFLTGCRQVLRGRDRLRRRDGHLRPGRNAGRGRRTRTRAPRRGGREAAAPLTSATFSRRPRRSRRRRSPGRKFYELARAGRGRA